MQQDGDGFLETLRSNAGIIRKVANAYCQNAADRDDLIQDITMQLWRSWTSYNPKYKLSTWIYKIALNVAISFCRKTYRRQALVRAIEANHSQILSVSNDSELSDNLRQLYQFISELDELNRALILLYLERYSYEEIADTLGISKTNVATKISRIKQKLKNRFQEANV